MRVNIRGCIRQIDDINGIFLIKLKLWKKNG